MADRRLVRSLVVAVLASLALLVAGCGGDGGDDSALVSGVRTSDNHGYHGTFLDSPYVVPDIALSGTDGASYSLADDPVPVKVVFFGYTNCPDICQVVMSTISSAVSRLDQAQQERVHVAFVTTDPARDTGPVLRTYLDRLDPDFLGVTGDLRRIVDLAKPLGVAIEQGQKLPSGGYEVTHGTYVYGVTGDQARVVWSQSTSPADLAADIIRLLKS